MKNSLLYSLEQQLCDIMLSQHQKKLLYEHNVEFIEYLLSRPRDDVITFGIPIPVSNEEGETVFNILLFDPRELIELRNTVLKN